MVHVLIVCVGRKTCNFWFAYSVERENVNACEAHSVTSQLVLDSLEFVPRDYDKDLHDHHNHTVICECVTFLIAHIPNREPLRLVLVDRYEPRRIETPRWIDAWEKLDDDENVTSLLINFDAILPTMKKVSVFRPRELEGEQDALYALRWATIHALSGMFDDNAEVVDTDSENEDN